MNQRRRGRKVTSVSTNVKSIVPRPRVPEVLFSRDLTETASSESETQGQSVGSGENGCDESFRGCRNRKPRTKSL